MTITPPHPKKLGYTAEDMLLAEKQRAKAVKMPFLPVELIVNILGYLEAIDLIRCTLVCKFFDRLVNESSRLMYTLELAKARMVSVLPPEDTPTFASRLSMLRTREQDWRVLGWQRRTFVDLPPTGSLYEFVGGVYANGREGDNRLTTSISFLELPSADTREDQLKTWSHSMPDLNIIDFTMDPGQDLLVLVAVALPQSEYIYELHVRSIKANQPHGRAPSSVFPCMRKPHGQATAVEVITAVRVQVCGDLVALLIKDVMENSGGHLEIWNWKAGPTHSCSLPRTQGIDDFSFLTESVALIVRPTGQFEVYDFLDPAHHSSEPTLRYAFAFPPLSPGYSYWYISMSNNPTPGYIPKPEENQANMRDFLKGNRQVYHPDPKERVHSCCLYVFNPADPVLHAVSSFVFFIKIETLLNPPMFWFQRPVDREGRMPYCHPSVFEGQPEFAEGMWHRHDEGEEVRVRGGDDEEVARGRGKGKAVDQAGPSSRSSSMDSVYGSGLVAQSEAGAEPPPDSQESLPELELDAHGFLTGDNDYDQLYGPPPYYTFDSQAPSAGPSSSTAASSSSSTSTSTSTSLNPLLAAPTDSTPTETATMEPQHVPIPWEVWGPRNTRWFEECLSTDWQHAIYGLRAVESVEVSKMTAERQFDIDNWPIGRGGSSSLDAQGSGGGGVGGTTGGPAGPTTTTTVIGGVTVTMTTNGPQRREKRFLRVRDFSPYSIQLAQEAAVASRAFSSSLASTPPSSSSSTASHPTSRPHTPHDFTSHPIFKGKGRCRSVWRTPKVVGEPSRVPAMGVFQHDIVSMLPYVETVSDETFEVTDVMMDDERVLLLKRGTQGRLKSLEVLMM